MYRAILKAVIFCLLWVCIPVYAQYLPSTSPAAEALTGSSYRFKAIDHEDLQLIGGLWAIAQDKHGFMWFGGENGLARFDGYEVTLYRHEESNPNSLSSSYIRNLLIDSEGSIWIATNYGLNLYQPDSDDFRRYLHDPENQNSLSGNSIHSIVEDRDGMLWLGSSQSGVSRFDKSTSQFEHFTNNSDPNSLSNDSVYTMFLDAENSLWVGTLNNGLDRLRITPDLTSETAQFSHFRHAKDNPQSISSNAIISIYQDHLKNIWVGTDRGLNRLEEDTQQFHRYFVVGGSPLQYIQTIGEDAEGNVWVANSGDGISLYHHQSNTFIHYQNEPDNPSSLIYNNVRAFYLDRDDNFWLGHFASGVSMVDRYARGFKNYYHNAYSKNTLDFNEMVAVVENSQGDLWIGSARGLNYLNRKTDTVTRYIYDKNDKSSIESSGVLGLLIDSKQRLWVGQWGGGLSRLDPKTTAFHHYKNELNNETTIPSDYIWALAEDSSGRIWVGSHQNGLSYYVKESDNFVRIPKLGHGSPGINCDSVFSIFEDSVGDLWVGCANGLNVLKKNARDFEHFQYVPNAEFGLSSNHIWTINEDSQGRLWFGTQDGGVNRFDRKTGRFHAYRVKNGLSDNSVTGVLEDDSGMLWFSTGNGLSKFDPVTESFKNYGDKYGVAGKVFNRAAYTKTHKGELVFGSSEGLTIVNTKLLFENQQVPEVNITGFQLFNKDVPIGGSGSPLTKSILEADRLTLAYAQSSFSFKFAAVNYNIPSENTYAYYLEGFDQDWNYVGARRQAYYTNLGPGKYVFRVKAANNEGVWSDVGDSLNIVIPPPWWRTWWAYVLYVMLFFGVVLLVVQVFWQRKLTDNERRISDQLRSMDKVKDSFLANTSHELRTPLSGMIGLSESLKEGIAGELPPAATHYLDMIIVSGRRLANLVNDILDFSKLRESKIVLKKTHVDLYSLIEVVIVLFMPLLKGRPIKFINEINPDLPLVYADENRLQQILYNLIGNAVKFTDEGSITLSDEVHEDHIVIFVKDTGVGISKMNHGKVFDSFEQIENSSTHGDIGTGLGLAVTKQLVELHGGTVNLKSVLGQGTCMCFTLPLSREVDIPLNNTSSRSTAGLTQVEGVASFTRFKAYQVEKKAADIKSVCESYFHILIVDDDPVNRLVLNGYLKLKNYQVSECVNGIEALEALSPGNDIDLVLLDVMMPRLSGFETCKKIREQYARNDLPVIFLTGRNQSTDIKEGYAVGGNDFLTKPVAKEELLARVETHLKLAEKMRSVR